MQLREKLILEEPEDEILPPALPDEPIVVSTKPDGEVETALSDVEEPVEKVDDEIERNAYASLLMNEISATYESIDRLNSIIATVTDKYGEDVVSQLNSLVDGRTLEIGALHTILSEIDPKTGELIYDGMQNSEAFLPPEEPSEEGSEVEFASAKYDDEIVEEDLNDKCRIVKTNRWYDPEGLDIDDDRVEVVFEGTRKECDDKLVELYKELKAEFADRKDIDVSLMPERKRNPETGEISSLGKDYIEVYYLSAIAKEYYRIVCGVDEKVTRADKRIAKELNKHLSESNEVFGLFAYEIDPNTGRKIADYNDGEYIELSYDRKHLNERAKLFADSWNANKQGKIYKFTVKSLGIR